MSYKLIFYDVIRRTKSKSLIAFIAFILIGKLSPRFKVLKAYKDYSFKEIDERRKFSFNMTLDTNKYRI